MISILNTPELIGLFTQEQLNEIGYSSTGDMNITWNEILEFIQKTDQSETNSSTHTTGDHNNNQSQVGIQEEMPEYHAFNELVEPQSKALEIDYDGNGLKVSMMETDDIRVVMSSSNKLIVSSDVDAIDLVTEYATRCQLPDTSVPILLDHVERAVIKASQQELKLLEEMSVECMNQLEAMADVLLSMEFQMMVAIDDCKRAQFISGTTTANRRGSVQQDVRMAIQAASSGQNKNANIEQPTPGELAKKLSSLQHRVAKKEEEVLSYSFLPFLSLIFNPFLVFIFSPFIAWTLSKSCFSSSFC